MKYKFHIVSQYEGNIFNDFLYFILIVLPKLQNETFIDLVSLSEYNHHQRWLDILKGNVMTNERDQHRNQPGKTEPHPDKVQQDKSRMGDKPTSGARPLDQGKVGQDTDGDGKTVKPGQQPGQSHGTGQIKK